MATPTVEQNNKGELSLSEGMTLTARLANVGVVSYAARFLFWIRAACGWCVGYLVGLFPFRERKIALLQLRVFLPQVNAHQITRRVFAHIGRVTLESLSLRSIVSSPTRFIDCKEWNQVEQWTQDKRPIIALTGHTGNWDLLASYVIARGVPLTTVGREARSPLAQTILQSIRSGYGIETVWRSDKSALKRLMQCLKERRVIAALIDQDTHVESIPVPFFGQPAKTPVSLIRLGKKFDARFVAAFLFRTGMFRYSVFVEELPSSNSEYTILESYNQCLERYIRKFPEQWVWFHKRWRTTDTGVSLSSKEYIKVLEQRAAVERRTDHTTQKLLLGLLCIIQYLIVLTAGGCSALSSNTDTVYEAEECTQQGQYDEAIQLYYKHIERRLAVSNRPEWENPHFYLLRIGDLYLRQEQPQAALDAYRQAEQHSVEASLISDRYRALAHWYLEHNQLEAAFEILKTYRDRDSLLFDAMLDRVGRSIVAKDTVS